MYNFPSAVTPSRSESVIVTIVLLVFLLLGFVVASRLPINNGTMVDEIMFIDPATNLYFGNGFTSSAWFAQAKNEFWAGYPPLYSLILFLWMQIFGFSIATAKSLNYVLIIVAGLLLWLSVIRLNLVNSTRSRVTLIAIFLANLEDSFNYRTGRPDSLTIVLSLAALLAYSIQSTWLRCLLLACISIFIPLTGLQLAAYAVILPCILLAYLRTSFLRESVSIAIGLAIGTVSLYILYSTNGVWQGFIKSIRENNSVKRTSLFSSLHGWKAAGFFKDDAFKLLLLVLLSIIIYKLVKAKFRLHSQLSFGLVVSFCIPFGMMFLSAYPRYYNWMAFIPLAICVCSEVSISSRGTPKGWLSLLIIGCLLAVSLSGYFRGLAVLAVNWKALDYSPIEALVEKNVTRSDWVVSDSVAYYAAKTRAATVIYANSGASYLNIIPSQEKEHISALIIEPEKFENVVNTLGGKWYDSGRGLSLKSKRGRSLVDLKIYRRDLAS